MNETETESAPTETKKKDLPGCGSRAGSRNGRTSRTKRLREMTPAARRLNRIAFKAKNAMMHEKAVIVDRSKRLKKKPGGARKRGVKGRA